MLNRIDFFNSISNINNPDVVIRFYDHFLALKQIIDNATGVNDASVDKCNNTSIRFSVSFQTAGDKKGILGMMQSGTIIIYGRSMNVLIEDASVRQLLITIKG